MRANEARPLRARTLLAGVVAGILLTAAWAAPPVSQAATAPFTARGSAEQVDVTGLPANASASLLNSGGSVVATQNADSLGGLLFRNVTPGSGYTVRLNSTGTQSAPVTVHNTAAAPWDPSIYNQSIADNGYTYLTTRDGTQLAIDVHPPTSPAGEPGVPAGTKFPPSYCPSPAAWPIRPRRRPTRR